MSVLSLFSCTMHKEECYSKVDSTRFTSRFTNGEKGIGQGVSACYAGIIGGKLLMAGGCNFPDVPVAEGGKKQFYSGIYLADIPKDGDSLLVWNRVGELPVPSAYGVSLPFDSGIICIGGTDGNTPLASVYLLNVADTGGITIKYLPSLPCPLDNMGGAIYGDTVYVAGGNASGEPSNRLFTLDMKQPEAGWCELTPFPGNPRVQPVCAVQKSEGEIYFYIWGGFSAAYGNNTATLSTDGYRYSVSRKGWEQEASPVVSAGDTISLGGGSAVALSDSLVIFTGGVNKDIFLKALQRDAALKKAVSEKDIRLADSLQQVWKEYMLRPSQWYGFNKKILLYNSNNGTWRELPGCSGTARAGAALVADSDTVFCIGGELKPGIRTSSIVQIIPKR